MFMDLALFLSLQSLYRFWFHSILGDNYISSGLWKRIACSHWNCFKERASAAKACLFLGLLYVEIISASGWIRKVKLFLRGFRLTGSPVTSIEYYLFQRELSSPLASMAQCIPRQKAPWAHIFTTLFSSLVLSDNYAMLNHQVRRAVQTQGIATY